MEFHFRFNISCDVTVKLRSDQKSIQVIFSFEVLIIFKVLFIFVIVFIFEFVFIFGIIFIFVSCKNYEFCIAKNLSMALLKQALALLVTIFLIRGVDSEGNKRKKNST